MADDTDREVVVAVFPDRAPLEAAIDRLQSRGLDRSQLSLLSGTPEEAEEVATHETPSLDRDPRVDSDSTNVTPLVTGLPAYAAALVAVGVTVASGGTLAGVAVAALAAGAGGAALGAGANALLQGNLDRVYEDQLRLGGLILAVHPVRPEEKAVALEVLSGAGAVSVDTYPVTATSNQSSKTAG
jgi:hypothetical protein